MLKSAILSTYDELSQVYDQASGIYWQKYSIETVHRLQLRGGECVLDVACGTGASALCAAQRIDPQGRVIAVDFSKKMIATALAKAQQRGLRNVHFIVGDMRKLEFLNSQFDVVICVFGLFFVEDMAAQIARFWRLVRPGGLMALTAFGAEFLSPVYDFWKKTILDERPDLVIAPPWERINAHNIEPLLRSGGVDQYRVESVLDQIPLGSTEDWWSIVVTSGLASYLDHLGKESISAIHEKNSEWLRRKGVESLTVDVIYVSALKPHLSPSPP